MTEEDTQYFSQQTCLASDIEYMHPLRIALQLGISTFLLLSVPSSHLLQQDPSLTPTTAPPKKNLSCASQPFQLLQQLAYLHAQQRVGGTGPIRGLQGGGEGAKSRRCHDHTYTHSHTPDERGEGTGFNLLWKKNQRCFTIS